MPQIILETSEVANFYGYFLGNCPGPLTLIEYTTENSIQVELNDYWGGGTDYCYQICTYNDLGKPIIPICCCSGVGTVSDPTPDPTPNPSQQVWIVEDCCQTGVFSTALVENGTQDDVWFTAPNSPDPGICYKLVSTTNQAAILNFTLGSNYAQGPLNNGCENSICECEYHLVNCTDDTAYLNVQFSDSYTPNLGVNGDTYQIEGLCYYFESGTIPTGQLTIASSDVDFNACECTEQSYSAWGLVPCCDNYANVQTIGSAWIEDGLNIGQGDYVQLDGVCYQLASAIQEAQTTPGTQIAFQTCELCLAASNQSAWCVYEYISCVESQLGVGNMTVNPILVNAIVPTSDPVGTNYEVVKLKMEVDNGTPTPLTIHPCYTYNNVYNPAVGDYSVFDNSPVNCCELQKCDIAYLKIEACTDGIAQTGVASIQCNDIIDNNLTNNTTFASPGIYESFGVPYGQSWQPYVLGGVSCHTIVGGNDLSITSNQLTSTGISWVNEPTTDFSPTINCNSDECGCYSDVQVTNNTLDPITINVNRCDSTDIFSYTIQSGETFTVTTCISLPYLMYNLTSNGYDFADVTIDTSSAIPCE